MKLVSKLLLLIFALSLSGCAGLFSGGDRWGAVETIRVAEEQTKQELLRTKRAEFESNKSTENKTFAVTTYDTDGKPVSTISMDLAPVIQAATGSGNNDTYGVVISTTELPEGAVAETIRAVGSAGKDILMTPTAAAFTVGAVINGALSETGGGGTHINGETINANDSFNRTEVHATGEGNTATANAREESKTEIPEGEENDEE